MTFADSVLHLVRAGARIESRGVPDRDVSADAQTAVAAGPVADEAAVSDVSPAPSRSAVESQLLAIEMAAEAGQDISQDQPGIADLEAAVGLVSAGLAVHAIEKCVDEDVAAIEAQLGEETLHAMTGGPDQNSPYHGLVLGRVLANAEHASRAIQPAPVKDGSPLISE